MAMPLTTNGESVALYALPNGAVGMSILGHRAVEFDEHQAEAFARYLTSMVLHSARTKT